MSHINFLFKKEIVSQKLRERESDNQGEATEKPNWPII